jgi:hypothetical protein
MSPRTHSAAAAAEGSRGHDAPLTQAERRFLWKARLCYAPSILVTLPAIPVFLDALENEAPTPTLLRCVHCAAMLAFLVSSTAFLALAFLRPRTFLAYKDLMMLSEVILFVPPTVFIQYIAPWPPTQPHRRAPACRTPPRPGGGGSMRRGRHGRSHGRARERDVPPARLAGSLLAPNHRRRTRSPPKQQQRQQRQ